MFTLGLLNRNTGCQCCSDRCSSMLNSPMHINSHTKFQLGFFKISIFNSQNCQEDGTASLCQILSKSLQPRPRYGDFAIFQDGGRRYIYIYVGFLKFQIFNGRKGQEGQSASVRHISSKSLELWPRYGDYAIF